MKKIIFNPVFALLLLLVVGMGCKKKDTYDPDSIIGTWQWIYSGGGFAGRVFYPQPGQTVIARYTECNVSVTDNDSIIFKAPYRIIDDILIFYIDGDRVQITNKYKIESDTLTIIELGFGMEGLYKRIH